MDTFTLDKVTASVVYDTRRPKKNELFPVKYRVTFNRKQYYYPTGIDLALEEWAELPTTRKRELKEQRELIQAGFEKIKRHIKDLVKGEGFTPEQLRIRLSRGVKNSIFSSFYSRIDRLNNEEKYGTAEWYKYSAESLRNFLKRDLKFSEVTPVLLKRYEAFLIENEKSYTTISMYMRALAAIVNEGMRQGIISQAQYPFGKDKYMIPKGSGRKMALTLSQIGEILSYPLVTDMEKMCRDLWFFSYLCNGINITDLCNLKYSDISNNKIYYSRQKTKDTNRDKKEIVAILLSEMKDIIDKWGSKNKKSEDYIFPFIDNDLTLAQKRMKVRNLTRIINKKMSAIGKALDYGTISTYTARHSYATVLKRSGTSIAFISESLGHSDLKTTENYLASFEDDERIKNAALLTKFNLE